MPRKFDSIKDISKVQIQKAKEKPLPEPVRPPREDAEIPEEDLFFQAVRDVRPLSGSGRELAPNRPPPDMMPAGDQGAELRALKDLVDGSIDFEVEFSDEYVQAHVHGFNARLFHKLKLGKFSIEGHLDLHGLNTLQAHTALLDFIRESSMAEKRCLLVVTGRGRNSPAGMPVLKQEIQRWLTQEPFRRIVLAFCTSQPRDGGTGALYVMLRKSKKVRGKVIWNKWPMDLE